MEHAHVPKKLCLGLAKYPFQMPLTHVTHSRTFRRQVLQAVLSEVRTDMQAGSQSVRTKLSGSCRANLCCW